MKATEKTLLNTLLSNPDLKSGIVVGPTLSGKSYALCSKAVDLAFEGNDVLLVKESGAKHYVGGGSFGQLEEILLNHPNKPTYITNSGYYDVGGGGTIKLVGLDYVVKNKIWDYVLMDNVPLSAYLSLHNSGRSPSHCRNKILATTAFNLVKSPHSEKVLRSITDLGGTTRGMELPSICRNHTAGEGFRLNLGFQGAFNLEMLGADVALLKENPIFESYSKNGWYPQTYTDYMDCLNYTKHARELL